ncbi:MAG TPA: hypothetical protein VMU02_09130 [bacterium]|nr:hypothetical protein [bacterium]
MANGRVVKKAKTKRLDARPDRSLTRKIEGIDKRMQTALEKGDFAQAIELAEEQERLLEHLMLGNQR